LLPFIPINMVPFPPDRFPCCSGGNSPIPESPHLFSFFTFSDPGSLSFAPSLDSGSLLYFRTRARFAQIPKLEFEQLAPGAPVTRRCPAPGPVTGFLGTDLYFLRVKWWCPFFSDVVFPPLSTLTRGFFSIFTPCINVPSGRGNVFSLPGRLSYIFFFFLVISLLFLVLFACALRL